MLPVLSQIVLSLLDISKPIFAPSDSQILLTVVMNGNGLKNVIFLRERLDYSAPNEEFIVYEDFPSKNDQASFAFLSFPEF